MWPFSGWQKLRRRMRRLWRPAGQGESIDLEELMELGNVSPAKKYINLLLWEMAEQDVAELTLWQSQALPSSGKDWKFPEPPPFASVVNRFKIMAGLDPVIYHDPKEGQIELLIGGESILLDVRFVDIGSDRSVHLRMEWPDRPKQAQPQHEP